MLRRHWTANREDGTIFRNIQRAAKVDRIFSFTGRIGISRTRGRADEKIGLSTTIIARLASYRAVHLSLYSKFVWDQRIARSTADKFLDKFNLSRLNDKIDYRKKFSVGSSISDDAKAAASTLKKNQHREKKFIVEWKIGWKERRWF